MEDKLLQARSIVIEKKKSFSKATAQILRRYKYLNTWGAWGPSTKNLNENNPRDLLCALSQPKSIVVAAFIPKIITINSSLDLIGEDSPIIEQDLSIFRGVTERIVVLDCLQKELKSVVDELKILDPTELIKNLWRIQDISATYGVGRRFDWRKAFSYSFEEIDKNKLSYNLLKENETEYDIRSTNIITQIEKFNKKKMPGVSPFYSFLCDFLHPNFGDLLSSSTQRKEIKSANRNNLSIQTLTKNFHSNQKYVRPEIDLIVEAYIYFIKLLDFLIDQIPVYESMVSYIVTKNTSLIHKQVKKMPYKQFFTRRDLCPCGSGKIIQNCS